MKKWLLVLGMITCIFGVGLSAEAAETAETAETTAAVPEVSEDQVAAYGDQLVESIATVCAQNMQSQYASNAVIAAALDSWTVALEDMGSYVKILEHTAELTADGAVANVKVEGTKSDAMVKIVMDETYNLVSITTTPISPVGEWAKTGTIVVLVVLGAVFVVFLIVGFAKSRSGFVPKIKAAFTDQPETGRQPDNAIAQIVSKEEYFDDRELVAAIAAAIAASSGASSTDGFVVRSIRKRRVY